MAKLEIVTPKGAHIGIHCFRHGVTRELLESGTPIHVVTRLMRYGDSQVTLNHYAHIIGNAERVASKTYPVKLRPNGSQNQWSQPRLRQLANIGLGGSVWESNPPFDPLRTESPALKAGEITGPLSPPREV
jgi:hypothetical protein